MHFWVKHMLKFSLHRVPLLATREGPVSRWGPHCWSLSETGAGTDGSRVQPQRAAVACVTSGQNFITELDVFKEQMEVAFHSTLL